MPEEIFPAEYLRKLFFEDAPQVWKLSAADMRRALKSFAKKTTGERLETVLRGLQGASRDTALIKFICDNGKLRDKFNIGYTRTGNRPAPKSPNFIDSIWTLGFRNSSDESMVDLAKWFDNISSRNVSKQSKRYIYAQTLRDAVVDKELPCLPSDVAFSRAIMLYSALLQADERNALLLTAQEIGAKLPRSCIPTTSTVTQAGNSIESRANETTPRLKIEHVLTPTPPDLRIDLQEKIQNFRMSQGATASTSSRAKTIFSGGPERIVQGNEADFEYAIKTLQSWRNQLCVYECLKQEIGTLNEGYIRNIEEKLEVEILIPKNVAPEDLLKICADAAWATEFYDPDNIEFIQWKLTKKTPLLLEQLSALPPIHFTNTAKLEAINRFDKSLKEALPGLSVEEVKIWLPGLTALELLRVAVRAYEVGGILLRALIVAYGVEHHGAVFAEQVAKELLPILDKHHRRTTLQFIQSSSTKLDGATNFKRYVCREHLANLLLIGPLAQITDISVGITDTDIVGHNIPFVVEAIIGNLDILSSCGDIIDRLSSAQRAGDSAAAKAAVEFIQTPAGMSGHYRRLREYAREHLLTPLVNGQMLNIRLAKDVIRSISEEKAENIIFDEVSHILGHADKLESQHKQQLARYLQTASKHLEAAVRTEASKTDARTLDLAGRLNASFALMAKEGLPGSIEWLEGELLALIFRNESEDPTYISLTGSEQGLEERLWSVEDKLIRETSRNSVHFHQTHAPSLWNMMCGLLAEGPRRDDEIIDQLILLKDFSGALKFAVEVMGPSNTNKALRKRVEEAASPYLRDTRVRLAALGKLYSKEAVSSAEAYLPLRDALAHLKIDDAQAYVSLLEAELKEQEIEASRAARELENRVASAELVARLLRAGHQISNTLDSLSELQKTWSRVLCEEQGRRCHLLMIQQVMKPINSGIPEFATVLPLLFELDARVEDPDWWLSEENAQEIVDYLASGTQHLKGWIDVTGILPSETRRTLSALLSVFLTFFYDQVIAIRTSSGRDEINTILESIIDFDAAISSHQNPSDCLTALAAAGFASQNVPTTNILNLNTFPASGRRLSEDFARSAANAMSAKAWPELQLLAANARSYVSEDEIHRIDDAADFAQFMTGIEAGKGVDVSELLEGAARAVCTSGHPINRSLSAREKATAALDILRFAVGLGDINVAYVAGSTSWSEILVARPNLFRSVEAELFTHLSRVMAAMFSSSQAYELADQVWSSATKATDAAVLRADVLCYLNEQGQNDAIVKICSKYDAAIKAKVEQMLELRAAAMSRPDLIPVADALGSQVATATKLAPVRQFIKRLPTTTQVGQGTLQVVLQDDLVIRSGSYNQRQIEISVTVVPEGIVPANLQVQVLVEDDVTFANRSGRFMMLSEELIYVPKDFVLSLVLGDSWDKRVGTHEASSFRLRFGAKTVTESIVSVDLEVNIAKVRSDSDVRSIDRESLLEYYPGVGNTPALGKDFVGRDDSLEQLHNFLVAARQPSPVLLTGMRRVGKTSLLQEFHRRHHRPGASQVVTLYLSIAELRHQFLSKESTVSATLYRAIGRALSKRDYSAADHNRELGARLRQATGGDRAGMRAVVQDSYDPDSLSDSLMVLSDRVIEATNSNCSRLVVLLDEAESLIVPYHQGGEKRVELEQLLQSLREISQTSDRFGIVLSGSNHIMAFAREYKNAFFGSCVNLELEGITSFNDAAKLISPIRVMPFVQFEPAAIKHAVELCAGMPQFMWQLGAATVYAVRGGKALRADVRTAVKALVDGDHTRLPFKSYDVLEPIEHMLGLQGEREQDLLWLLLRRVALTSSLSALHAPRHFVVESGLLEIDSRASWNKRLQTLVELKILIGEANNSYRFKVPLFAEGFRAAKTEYESQVRFRRLAV